MEFGEAVREFEEFFSEQIYREVAEAVQSGDKSVVVNYQELEIFNPELSDYLTDKPESGIDAAHEGVKGTDIVTDEGLKVRFTNMPEEDFVKLKNLRSKHIGRFVPVDGMIKRASQVKPELTKGIFECTQCGDQYEKEQDSSELKSPYKCECGSRKFEVVEKVMTDTQNIILEENPESREGSSQPATLSIRLEGDLVDPDFQKKVVPGNITHVTGILREKPFQKNSKKYDIYMEANYLDPVETEFEELELNDEEIEKIKQLKEESDDIFERITHSIAPSIYGHKEIKKAIALQMFGGVKKTREDGVESRGDLHILLIGEPGTGKSQMLRFTGEIAPKGRYVVGKSSTGAGLTAAAVRNEQTGEFELEAGAVVLANKGMAAIDEIDKMGSEDRSSLHEAMEQQCFAPKTQLYLPKGNKKNIKEIVDPIIEKGTDISTQADKEVVKLDEPIEILSSNMDNLENEKSETTVVGRRKAPEKMLNIKLQTGRSIEVTPEHDFYQIEEGTVVEKHARELKKNDFVIAPRELPIEGEEQKLDDINVDEGRKEVKIPEHNSPALAKFTGYQVSDGGYEMNRGKKNGFNFCNSNNNLIEDYSETVEQLFDVEPYIRNRGDRKSVRVISKELKDWLEELGPIIESGEEKKIPPRLMKCRKEEIALLLRAFFDGNGGVYRVKRGHRVRAVVENRELIEQIQELLLRFGIHSVIRNDKNVWRIDISRYEDLQKFHENIGFKSEKKAKRLKEALEQKRDSKEPIPGISDTLMDLVQHLGLNQIDILNTNLISGQKLSRKRALKIIEKLEDRIEEIEEVKLEENIRKLRDIREEFQISMREIAENIGVDSSSINYWEKNGTERTDEYLESLKKCLKERKVRETEIEELRNLLENFRFIKIREITEFEPKYEYVYDLTVQDNENFIAENIVAHNSISVAKANIQATLNAETSILAAGNPKLGRFDPYEPIPQQIELGDTLLSRFDFIFPVKDEPDEERDKELSGTVLQNHMEPEETTPDIDGEKLRKYIAYAKKNLRPDLTQEAADRIQEFYIQMRKGGSDDGDSVPITARQLEALVRVAEASARTELREEVIEKDAQRAIDILTYCLQQIGVDPETGDYDIDMIESGVSSSQRNRLQTLKQIIRSEGGDENAVEVEAIIDAAAEQGLEKDKAEEIINRMKREGDLWEPQPGHIQQV